MVETPVETPVNQVPDTPVNVKKKRDIKGGIILSVIGLLILYMGIQEVCLLTSGDKVTGTIVGYHRSAQKKNNDKFHTYDVKYAYYYGGKRYQGSFTQKAYDIMTINPGKQIGVTVLPDSPAISKATDKLNPLYTLLELAGGLALLGFGMTRFKGQEIAI